LRIVVALLLITAVGGVGFLVLFQGDGPGKGTHTSVRRDTPRRGNDTTPVEPPPPTPLPDIAKTAKANPFTADTQRELAAFVEECRQRGAEAVPLLLQLLADGKDRKLQPRWKFVESELIGFPTLRAAYLTALTSIDGPEASFAMGEIMKELRDAQESFLIAKELADRDVGGWTNDLLRNAVADATPAQLDLRRAMVALAARSDPKGTAEAVLRDMPRGESKEDGRLLSESLGQLPVQIAIATTESLLADRDVTYAAKGHLVRAALNRPEPDVFRAMRQEVLRGGLDKQLRTAVAYAAANSRSFFNDAAELAVAEASQDTAKGDAIRRRFEERMRVAEELVGAALDVDMNSTTDMRAAAMRRTLAAHRAKLEGK